MKLLIKFDILFLCFSFVSSEIHAAKNITSPTASDTTIREEMMVITDTPSDDLVLIFKDIPSCVDYPNSPVCYYFLDGTSEKPQEYVDQDGNIFEISGTCAL